MSARAGEVVLVTGATDGIGRATLTRLLESGARLVLHGRDPARLADLRDQLEAGAVVGQVVADFRSLAQVRSIPAQLAAQDLVIDTLVHNAGVFHNAPTLTEDGLDAVWSINLVAPLLSSEVLLDAGRGPRHRIVFVSSDAYRFGQVDAADPLGRGRPFDRMGHYAGSKLGLILVAFALGRRLAARGITVDALHPGVVATKLLVDGFGATQGMDRLDEAAAYLARVILDPGVVGQPRYFERDAVTPLTEPHRRVDVQDAFCDALMRACAGLGA